MKSPKTVAHMKIKKKKSDKKWHGFALSSYLDQYDSNFKPNHL